MSNQIRTIVSPASQSFFMLEGEKTLKLIQGKFDYESHSDNPKFASQMAKVSEKESMTSKGSKQSVIYEVELNMDAMTFLEKLRSEGHSSLRAVPAYFMRSICIKNLNELTPLVDIYFVLKNVSQDFKKVILLEDPKSPGLNAKICLVDFLNHTSAKKALNALNCLQSPLSKILSSDKNSVHAVWCEPLVDNINEMLKLSPYCFFENLFLANYEVSEFKLFLESQLSKTSPIVIKKIRQFTNKVLVQFSDNLPTSFFDSPLIFKQKLVPVVPAMKPCINLGKYKEKITRASVHFLNEEDKKILASKFSDGINFSHHDQIKKKAEMIYNKITAEEKKEKIRKEEYTHHKRERTKEEDKREKRDRSREKKASKKDRERSEEKSQIKQTANTNSNQANPNNYLAQLTSLLMTNQNSSNVLSNLQNLSMLGNLQNILSNPNMITMLQQLMTSNSNVRDTTNSFIPSQNTPVTNKPSPSVSNQQSSQINPVYKTENQNPLYYTQPSFTNNKTFFPTQNNPSAQFPFPIQGLSNEMFMNNMQFGHIPTNIPLNIPLNIPTNIPTNIPANIPGMHPDYGLPQMPSEDGDNNLVLKKYYEYYQSMNK